MTAKQVFDFTLGQPVRLVLSDEKGVIIGRANFLRCDPTYFIEYATADGRYASSWFDEAAILAVPPVSVEAQDVNAIS